MPAKRIIYLNRIGDRCRYLLRADVPAGNQIAYRNPSATSFYENATPTELQEIRDGLVAEKVGVTDFSAPTANIDAWLQLRWQEWQDEVTAMTAWNDYGRHWTGAAWVATGGVPMVAAKEVINGEAPTFFALTPQSGFAANKFHLVLFNGCATATGQTCVVKVRLIVWIPGASAVTGSAPSPFIVRRRVGLTTAPSGTGGVTIAASDSAQPLPSTIAAWSPPQVSPSGGTTATFMEFTPQADEQKLTTLDAPTMSTLNGWAGQIIYRAADLGELVRPLVIRANETLEIANGSTAGTGNGRAFVAFTVG